MGHFGVHESRPWMALRQDVHFNKRSPKSSCTLSPLTTVSLKGLVSYEDEEEKEEALNLFDPPPIFDDYDK